MNPLLKNIYEQPEELRRVLADLTGPKLDQVKHVAQLLEIADEVVLTSMGSAFYSLMPMHEALERAGKRSRLVETADLIHYPEKLSRNAVYVMMSRSGESREVADFSAYLKEHGYLCVAITMTPDSTMAKNATVVLHDVSSYDEIVCIKAYSTMVLTGLVCVAMMGRKEFDPALSAKLNAAFDWMGAHKEDILNQWEQVPFLDKPHNFYLLSRGFGMYVMRSCSLWVEETAKVCANFMSIDNFYHGPMEINRWAGRLSCVTAPLYLDVFGDGRSQMIWEKVCQNTPNCIYVGPAGPQNQGGACFETPQLGLEDPWMMIVLALYFQLMSYQTAIARGIKPGEFLDEGWVVT